MDGYGLISRTRQLYSMLSDEKSKQIFWARLKADTADDWTSVMELATLCQGTATEEEIAIRGWKDRLNDILSDGRRLVLYGTGGTGRQFASRMIHEKIEFYAFCGRRAAAFPDGLMGRPVLEPRYLIDHAGQFNVVISTYNYYKEILEFLRQNNFPEEHIIKLFNPPYPKAVSRQYFDFADWIPEKGAFVDAGCLDLSDSFTFSELRRENSAIFAFEPDPVAFQCCEEILKQNQLPQCKLFKAGLSDHTGTADLAVTGKGSGFLIENWDLPYHQENLARIDMIRLDDCVGNTLVGMIKMDIEGSELSALHGAAVTIRRDKPFLAICVYHKPGDLLSIMDYLSELCPDYRFWLRHYSPRNEETVLYASIRTTIC